jgi:hypothetical protein
MTEEVRPIARVERRDPGAADRRAAERRAVAASRALVVLGAPLDDNPAEPPARPAPKPPSDGSAAIFAAQMMGQSGQRRGLKGGPPVLDAARSAYLETKHSGAAERRPRPGVTEDTDI